MHTVCIGGGPAGLYLGVLLKLAQPRQRVTVHERNRPDDTFGFGVVFSDATLGNLADADPVTHAAITSRFARWDDIETHVRGHVFTSTGHGFCGLERKALLLILQDRARELGVELCFEQPVTSLDQVAGADLVVACDGVGSWVRDALAAQFEPDVDVRPNKFVWLGTTVPYGAFTFIFKETAHGLFRVHAYRYCETGSTFIVECTPATWAAAGFDGADEDRTIAILEDIFAAELGGHHHVGREVGAEAAAKCIGPDRLERAHRRRQQPRRHEPGDVDQIPDAEQRDRADRHPHPAPAQCLGLHTIAL